ncbi:MAG: site-specific integrase, partial [bacterium]|nr:site-specific integrase [bacterium]
AKPSVRPRTFESYSWIIREHIAPNLGRLPLTKLSPQDIQRFMNDRLNTVKCPLCKTRLSADGWREHLTGNHPAEAENTNTPAPLTPRTVQHIHATLRVALAQAEKWSLIPRNVATLVEAPRVPRSEIQPFTPEQARAFLDAIQGDRLAALYSVAVAIGLRQGEALGLRWPNIDFESGRLAVTHSLQRVDRKLELVETKRDRSRRTITLPQVCVNALLAHRARQEEERTWAGDRWKQTPFVFTTTVGTPLDGPTVTHRFQKALKAAG